jgi:hypothetical protein
MGEHGEGDGQVSAVGRRRLVFHAGLGVACQTDMTAIHAHPADTATRRLAARPGCDAAGSARMTDK